MCDPLVIETAPITLRRVIAAGRAPDGTLFVVASTSDSGAEQVFVLEGEALQRRNVLGSGAGDTAAGDLEETISFEDGGTPSRLVIKQRADVVVGMALVHDGGRTFFDALPSDAVQLELLAASEVQSLPVKNIPGMVTVEVVAEAPDGSQLVLTRPTVDWSYLDFRVYYGEDGKLIERVITYASRGNDTYLTFVVDGQDYNAILANAALSANASSTLRGRNGMEQLTLQSGTPHLPAGATFTCLR